jgi:cellobiose phosphorylase
MVAITQYILGVRAGFNGLIIDPCIPHAWKKYTVKRKWRGTLYEITISNPKGLCKGVKRLTVDGKAVAGNVIPIPPAGTVLAKVEAELE